MDGIVYKQSEQLHPRMANDSLGPVNALVSSSERPPTTYYSMQNTYLPPASSTTIPSQNSMLPTTTTIMESSTSALTQPTTAPTQHEQSPCTAIRRMNQAPDDQITNVDSLSIPVTRAGEQKCTRCKRWKMLDQFTSGGTNPSTFVGCLECRETAKKYGQSEFGKATRRNYNKTAKAKETRKKYAQSEKGKESRKKYSQTKRAKETRKKYNQSEKAKAARRKRALVKSGRMQDEKKDEENSMENMANFEIAPVFTDQIILGPSQETPNEKMNPMERAFWQTFTKTMYDQARRHHNDDIDGHDKFEVDIQLKYRRTR